MVGGALKANRTVVANSTVGDRTAFDAGFVDYKNVGEIMIRVEMSRCQPGLHERHLGPSTQELQLGSHETQLLLPKLNL